METNESYYINPDGITRKRYHRIGPAMRKTLEYIASLGGVARSALAVAEYCGPHGSRYYGYQIVDRLLRAGCVTRDHSHRLASPSGSGAICISHYGLCVIGLQDLASLWFPAAACGGARLES